MSHLDPALNPNGTGTSNANATSGTPNISGTTADAAGAGSSTAMGRSGSNPDIPYVPPYRSGQGRRSPPPPFTTGPNTMPVGGGLAVNITDPAFLQTLRGMIQETMAGQLAALQGSAATPPPPPHLESEEVRAGRAERRWMADSYAMRRDAYLAEGLTAAQTNARLGNVDEHHARFDVPFSPPATVAPGASTWSNNRPTPATAPATNNWAPRGGNAPRDWSAKKIGFYDGSTEKLEGFISRISSLYEQKNEAWWREPLLDTIPLCLTDSADKWYQSLDLHTRTVTLLRWENWKQLLRDAFGMDLATARVLAEDRKWAAGEENVADYYYDKVSLFRQAYPDRGEEDFVRACWMGLPDDFRLVIRCPIGANATCTKLLKEMRLYEGPWLATQRLKKGKQTAQTSSSSKSKRVDEVPNQTSPSQTLAVSRTTTATTESRVTKPRTNLKDTWSLSNVKMIKGKRHYQIPGTSRIMELDRPCGQCGKDHFDFEHDHLVKKADVNFADVDHYMGYPVFTIQTVEDEESDDSTMSASTSGTSSSYEGGPRFEELGNSPTARSVN